jgi:hypothetical protein
MHLILVTLAFVPGSDADALADYWSRAIENRERMTSFTAEIGSISRENGTATKSVARTWRKDERIRNDTTGPGSIRLMTGVNCPRSGVTFRYEERPQILFEIRRLASAKASMDVFDPRLVGLTSMPSYHRYGHDIRDFFHYVRDRHRGLRVLPAAGPDRVAFRCGFDRSPAIATMEFSTVTGMPLKFKIESGDERDTIEMTYADHRGIHYPATYTYRSERSDKELDFLRLDFRNVVINQPFDESAFELRGFGLRDDTHIRFEGNKLPDDYVWSNRTLVSLDQYRKANSDGGSTVIDEPILVDPPPRWPWLAGLVALAIVAIVGWRRYRSRS